MLTKASAKTILATMAKLSKQVDLIGSKFIAGSYDADLSVPTSNLKKALAHCSKALATATAKATSSKKGLIASVTEQNEGVLDTDAVISSVMEVMAKANIIAKAVKAECDAESEDEPDITDEIDEIEPDGDEPEEIEGEDEPEEIEGEDEPDGDEDEIEDEDEEIDGEDEEDEIEPDGDEPEEDVIVSKSAKIKATKKASLKTRANSTSVSDGKFWNGMFDL